MWLAPPTEFYPQYIADPRRAQSALLFMVVPYTEIPSTGDLRSVTRLGGKFPVVRWHPSDNNQIGFQLDLEAGFYGHFDFTESMDNIGWDGVYGVTLSYKPHQQLGFRFGTLHNSAHLGDEYMQETGATRIDYTREELVAGVSWQFAVRWRTYLEGAWAYEAVGKTKGERIQTGLEYVDDDKMWHGRFNWYAAVDMNMFNERDWQPATTAQLGVMMPSNHGTARYRIALEFFHGRSQMGEFSFYDESYTALGFYYDL